ncbi:START domain-containing protein [Telluribacter sp.]|jgi:hypothetical protein|uniref:START domain-containing protein n=1 Tax=Telluribacter sp. TaxID=1978767 RepID=UPI002E100A28|nr:START domain-containing protein [Telluribacter sp.]
MRSILLLIAFLILPVADDWEKEYTKNNIAVYTRNVDGSRFKSAKAETTYGSSWQNLQQMLFKPEIYSDLINNCESSEMVKAIDQDSFIAYLTFDSPWPFENRDVYIHFTSRMDNGNLVINLKEDESYDKKDEYVRIENLRGEWIINGSGGNTAASFTFFMNPGGSISPWMVNKKADVIVFNILLNIKNRL